MAALRGERGKMIWIYAWLALNVAFVAFMTIAAILRGEFK